MKNIIILGLLGLMLGIAGCANKSESGKTAEGIEYKIFRKGKGTEKIKSGDVIDFHIMILNAKDSALQSTFKAEPQRGLTFNEVTDKKQLANNFQAQLLNNFKYLAEGDSAIFKIPTDSISAFAEPQFKKAIEQAQAQLASVREGKMPDSVKAQQIQQMGMQIKQMENEYEKSKKDLPKGKFISYVFKIVTVSNAKKQTEKDAKDIGAYIQKNKLKTQVTASGLHYIMTKEGAGAKPLDGSMVKVSYVGKLLDGKVFDTCIEAIAKANGLSQPGRVYSPIEFPLGAGGVIKGWDEGIALLKKGAKATFIIPSSLAYGAQGRPPIIPANAILVFDVELVDFQKAQSPTDKGLK
jgi:FKBP-type peptidyl-prolyl cis-trans isomerase